MCIKSKIKSLQMIRDVATHWNSTAQLIERSLALREALNLLVNLEQHNRPRSSRLKRFQLTKPEWELLKRLIPLLEVSQYHLHGSALSITHKSLGISHCNKTNVPESNPSRSYRDSHF